MTAADPDNSTIPGLFWNGVAQRGDRPALGVIRAGQLQWRSWLDLAAGVRRLMQRLGARGVAPGDRVALAGPNSEAWIVADLAIQSLGAVHVPLHATLALEQMVRQITHSGARVALAADPQVAASLARQLPPSVTAEPLEETSPLAAPDERAAASPPASVAAIRADDLATILYTSGTTGSPRGVMLSHHNLATNVVATAEQIRPQPDEVRLVMLPLSHIYARTCDLYTWVLRGGRLVLAESRETVFRDCLLAEPTALNAVPYFYQKAIDQLRRQSDDGADALHSLFGRRIRNLYCGGAPLAPEVGQFFADRRLPILCGYGLTESSPVISITTAETYVAGTSGRPLPNLDVRLAEDGELLVRGPSVMRGYWADEPATAAAIVDGWLHTGDLATLDAAGNLRIVGRKKELMVLATGKKVAPTQIEQLLAGSPLVEQACVVGEGRKFLAALIVPNREALVAEIARQRLVVWSKRRAVTHPRVLAAYRAEIDRCLSGVAHCEQLGAFTLLTQNFSAERGEVTPKLSLRRETIAANYAREIARMYRE